MGPSRARLLFGFRERQFARRILAPGGHDDAQGDDHFERFVHVHIENHGVFAGYDQDIAGRRVRRRRQKAANDVLAGAPLDLAEFRRRLECEAVDAFARVLDQQDAFE